MKRFGASAAVCAVLLLLAGGVSLADRRMADEGAEKTVALFAVDGMTCGGCEAGVRVKVGKLDGIEKVTASYREGRAEVTYDPAKVTPEGIIAAIEELGYTAKLLERRSAGGGESGSR